MMEMFRQTYLEESFEGLSAMESNLLTLPEGEPDIEVVNTIFRAAHSMKGGAGTFGFTELINLTHILETMLDEMRSGKRPVTSQNREVLLRSVDVLRTLLDAYQNSAPLNMELLQEMEEALKKELANNGSAVSHSSDTEAETVSVADSSEVHSGEGNHFVIHLQPVASYFARGVDLIRLIRELSHFEGVQIHVDTQTNFPAEFDPEQCYLAFTVDVKGSVKKEQIEDVFEWLDEDCPFTIEAIHLENTAVATPSAPRDFSPAPTPAAPVNAVPAQAAVANPAAKPAAASTPSASPAHQAQQALQQQAGTQVESSIRVSISKIDQMVDLVGEMVIAQSMLHQFGVLADAAEMPWADKLKEGLMAIERHTRTMQESVMSIRMMPISFAFNRMPRIVHDISGKLNKEVDLVMTGEQTEVDKTVLEKLTDPLVHIIRNAADHGLETPEKRLAAGKGRKGTIQLSAFHSGGNIVIKIADDGAGINLERVKAKALDAGILSPGQAISDKEAVDLIFHAGFSTAEQITDISGRGVGMDVVRRNIRELGGVIEVETMAGRGSVFTIRLPLTLAILDGQLSTIGDEVYIFPLAAIVETIQPLQENIKYVTGQELFRLRDRYLPILRLNRFFGRPVGQSELSKGLLVVVEHGNKQFGVFVDALETQQQVVIKSMEQNYRKVQGVAGATILGDGRVSMILEISELAQAVGDGHE